MGFEKKEREFQPINGLMEHRSKQNQTCRNMWKSKGRTGYLRFQNLDQGKTNHYLNNGYLNLFNIYKHHCRLADQKLCLLCCGFCKSQVVYCCVEIVCFCEFRVLVLKAYSFNHPVVVLKSSVVGLRPGIFIQF
ncbi:hypothetical protein QVD17_29912 [Tagetes erecta]|uniref:Uncharacterized protein n=1 Tax=Tagetes erecta TaxID=13708 RepID=A0AAD8K379_TARER|nr:hypothetical protein QVD17_29912 [Tagetes erecta]